MAQITIYLDAKSERLIDAAARREETSRSRWARKKLLLAAGAPAWPEGYDSVLGSVEDITFSLPEDQPVSGERTPQFP